MECVTELAGRQFVIDFEEKFADLEASANADLLDEQTADGQPAKVLEPSFQTCSAGQQLYCEFFGHVDAKIDVTKKAEVYTKLMYAVAINDKLKAVPAIEAIIESRDIALNEADAQRLPGSLCRLRGFLESPPGDVCGRGHNTSLQALELCVAVFRMAET